MISIIQLRNSPKAEIKNENITPARKQMHTDEPGAVQCKASLRNSVFMVTEIGVQVSEEKEKRKKGRKKRSLNRARNQG